MAKEPTKKQEAFLKKKQLGHKSMPYLLLFVAICCFGSFLYLFFSQPILVDPHYVSQQITNNAIKPEVSQLMIQFFPVLLLINYVTMVITILIAFFYFRAEKQFLNIIKTLQDK